MGGYIRTDIAELKQLVDASVLAFSDYSLFFQLNTCSSAGMRGSVLSQKKDGTEKLIAYESRSLRTVEHNHLNHSSFNLEWLAMFWAMIERFAQYLTGICVKFKWNNTLGTSGKKGRGLMWISGR